jgi:hypothetical protein
VLKDVDSSFELAAGFGAENRKKTDKILAWEALS